MFTYYVGSEAILEWEFRDETGALYDPTTVTFKVRHQAAAAPTTYVYGVDVSVIKDAAGKYHKNQVLNAAGTWYYGAYGTAGSFQDAGETFLIVQSNPVAGG